LGPKGEGEGREDKYFKGDLANIIFTPGLKLGIFPSPTEACDWSGLSVTRMRPEFLRRPFVPKENVGHPPKN